MKTPLQAERDDARAGDARGASASARGWPRWRPDWLNRDLSLLFAGRGLRSLGQGYLAIIVPLYLARLGFDAEQLGVLFTASAITSALLAAAVGILSDRFGRKTFLILISLMMAAGGLVFALSGNFVVLVVAGALGTIGRGGGAGSGGAFGPYYPAEQPLIAEHASDEKRTTIFGALSFVGVLGGAIGSLLALAPAALKGAGFSLLDGYRALFLLTVFVGAAMVIVVLPVRERPARPAPTPTPTPTPVPWPRAAEMSTSGGTTADVPRRRVLGLSAPSWSLVSRFMVTNFTNGLAVGMLGPFVVYWFYRRFGVDAAELGTLFFVINLAAALPYLLAGRLARRLGAVNTVVVTRTASVLLLATVAVMPTYPLAAALYLVRMAVNTLSNPVRQSYLMGVITPSERSSAAGLANLPSQVATSVSPTLAGFLFQQVALALPLEFAAALQGLNTVLYYTFFHNVRPPEERARSQPVRAVR